MLSPFFILPHAITPFAPLFPPLNFSTQEQGLTPFSGIITNGLCNMSRSGKAACGDAAVPRIS